MTFQPPPRGNTPPSGSNRAPFDAKAINPLDWLILGVSLVVFIFSFFFYYSASFGPYSFSYGAWHWGGGAFVAWFAMVIGVLAGVPVALELFAPQVRLSVPARLASTAMFAASFVLYVLAIFAHSDFGPYLSHGFSFWLSLVLAGVGAVVGLMRLQQTGGSVPGRFGSRIPDISGYGPKGGARAVPDETARPQPGQTPSPPSAGYGPPAQ